MPARAPQTVVAAGVRVEGDFRGQGDIIIDGEVKGVVATDGLLTVGPNASVEADIHAEGAIIAGKVTGNVTIRSHVELKTTAHVVGDVAAATATVESGARLCGSVTIGAGPREDAAPDTADVGGAVPEREQGESENGTQDA